MKTHTEKQRFLPTGTLALHPQAFGAFFSAAEPEEPAIENGVAVIDICGPLMTRGSWFFDSYEGIKSRVASALAQGPRAIVLSIDSPGGVVPGCFDCARDLRAMCKAAGAKLFAHIGGTGASAAYALATSAEYIGVSQTAMVGSVGVIDTLVDATAQNAMMGLNIQLVASGARKADGNPNAAITEAMLQASQARVNELAEMFFTLCAEHGWSDNESLGKLQAAVMTGEQAVKMGLASAVATLDETIALASSGASPANEREDRSMGTPYEDAMKSLREAAESDNEEEAKKAKRALAAMEEDEDDSSEGAEGDEDEPEAEGDEDDPDAEDEGDEPEASFKGAKPGETPEAIALRALAEVHTLKAERTKEAKKNEREKLIASRPDFSEEMVAILRKSPLATVRSMVKTLPVGKPVRKTANNAAAVAGVTGTRGADQGGENAPRLPPEQKAELDAAMGLTGTKFGVVNERNRMVFGARLPKKD